MFDIFKNRLEITATLTTITALRVSAGRSTEPIGSDLPVIKDALGRPFIPGSSFKGALRSRLESFLRGIDAKFAANPAVESEWSIPSDEMKKLKENYTDDAALTAAILKQTDLVSRLFGSPWVASKFQVRDLTVKEETWFGQYQERDGVSIDRDTETAAEGKLYDYQVVPAGTSFELHTVVENAEKWELGLLMIGVHQFETEQIPLGGGRSRGLGVVKLNVQQMRWFDTHNDPKRLLGYLQKLVHNDKTAYEDAQFYKEEWTQALIDYLTTALSQPSTAQTPSA